MIVTADSGLIALNKKVIHRVMPKDSLVIVITTSNLILV
jgi:hypothetical protein